MAVVPVPSLMGWLSARSRGESKCNALEGVASHPHFIRRLQVVRRLGFHRGCVNTVSWTPDAMCVITGSDDLRLALWDTNTWGLRASWWSHHSANVFCARLLGTSLTLGSHIVSCGLDGDVRQHTVASDRVISSSLLFRHKGPAHKLSVSPIDASVVVSCGEDGGVAQLDMREPARSGSATVLFWLEANGRREGAYFVDHHCSGRYLLVGGDACLVHVYDLRRASRGPVSIVPERLRPYRHYALASGGMWRADGEELCVSYNDAFAATFSFTGRDHCDESGVLIDMSLRESCDAGAPSKITTVATDSLCGYRTCETSNGGGPKSNGHGIVDDISVRSDAPLNFVTEERKIFRFHRNSQTIKSITYLGCRGEWIVSGCDSGNVVFYRRLDGQVRHVAKGDSSGAVNCLSPHPHHLPVLLTSGLEHDAMVWKPHASRCCVPAEIEKWCRSFSASSVDSLDPNDWLPSMRFETDTSSSDSEIQSGDLSSELFESSDSEEMSDSPANSSETGAHADLESSNGSISESIAIPTDDDEDVDHSSRSSTTSSQHEAELLAIFGVRQEVPLSHGHLLQC